MSESKHTPMKDVFSMPLQCQGATLRQQDFAYGSRLIADLYDGNAGQRGAAIVRAVNCHDEMLAALKACRLELHHCAEQLSAHGQTGHPDDSVSRALRAADAAIAAAEASGTGGQS